MKSELAEKLIEMWNKDWLMFSDNFTKEERDDMGVFIADKVPARAFLASTNKRSSDALWDGNRALALRLLLKFGLSKPDEKYRREAKSNNSHYKTAMRNKKLANLDWEARKPTNWGTCK